MWPALPLNLTRIYNCSERRGRGCGGVLGRRARAHGGGARLPADQPAAWQEHRARRGYTVTTPLFILFLYSNIFGTNILCAMVIFKQNIVQPILNDMIEEKHVKNMMTFFFIKKRFIIIQMNERCVPTVPNLCK